MSNKLNKLNKLNKIPKKPKMPKILLGIPSCRDLPKETICSLLPIIQQVGMENVVFMQNAMINQCRDSIVKVAMDRKADYIFWVDDDMVIPPDALTKLLSHNKDICSGLYFGRGNFKPLLFDVTVNRDDDNLITSFDVEQKLEYEDNTLQKVGGIGFGCVLTKVGGIMDKMMEEWGTCFDFIHGKGEDLSFAVRCEDMGFETWVDTSVKCGHIGQLIINENHWKAVKDNYK